TFAASTSYTATITLTAKAGYTLTGVAADFFTVAGADSVSNSIDSGVITAVFPATEAVPMSVTVTKLAAGNVNQSDGNTTVSAANQNAVTVSRSGNTITVSGILSALNSFTSTTEGQGTHKWVCLVVNTGEADTKTVSYNGSALTQTDVDEAASVSVGAGSFVLWIKADEVATTPKIFTLSVVGKADTTITVRFSDTTPSSPSTPITSTQPTETTTIGDTTTAAATISGTTDTAGKTTAAVTESTVSNLVSEAQKAESAGKNAVVEIELKTTGNTKSAELTIPGNAFTQISDGTNADVKISAGIAAVTFDAAAAESIGKQAGSSNISITVEAVNASSLSAEAQKLVGTRPVYDFSVTAGGKNISSFGGASVSIPYTLAAGEDKNAIVIYYIDDEGKVQTVRGAYNSVTGTVDFFAPHFSQYAVGYNKVSFTDVASGSWYSDAVTFIAARGITNGTTYTTFSPNDAVTRGQFIVMLLRAFGIEPETNPTDNFTDAGNTYYTGYLAKAKSLGITNGMGGDTFQPNSNISRQDMFTLLYRALDKLGALPAATTDKTLADFSDAASVSDYAKDAFSALVKEGIVSGDKGMLDPRGLSTRAQMAKVLYALLSM
ncbi:MAG: S-layer homology domain-containing protein, partial [Clostridiaceae bacterium]|nr:S-layer homology domain-containing protein [Clostridiaceae bacterium]